MALRKQVANYFVEIVGMAIFLLSLYRIIVIIYSEPLTDLWYYAVIGVLSLFLMNYKNLGHHIKKAVAAG